MWTLFLEAQLSETLEAPFDPLEAHEVAESFLENITDKIEDKFDVEKWFPEAVPGWVDKEARETIAELSNYYVENEEMLRTVNDYAAKKVQEKIAEDQLIIENLTDTDKEVLYQDAVDELLTDVSEVIVGEIMSYARHVHNRFEEGKRNGEGLTVRDQLKNAMLDYKDAWNEGRLVQHFVKGCSEESVKVARDLWRSGTALPRLGWKIGKTTFYGIKAIQKKRK